MTIKKNSFVTGALILSAGMFISRAVGVVYRIALPRVIGAEGVGLFNYAYPVYSVVLVLSTAGIPVAVSKLVSARLAQSDGSGAMKVFRLSLGLLTVLGLVFSVGLFLLAGPIASNVIHDPRAYYSIVAIAPATFFVSVMSAYRGFFQGLQFMTPSALSQIIEQVVRVATIVLLSYAFLPMGVEYAAAGGTFGAVTGAVAGLGYLITVYWRSRSELAHLACTTKRRSANGVLADLKELLALAIPISISSLIFPLMQSMDMLVVPSRLRLTGLNAQEVAALYGQLSGMAMPLVYLPSVLTTAIAYSLVPAVSEALALNRKDIVRSKISAGLRLTLLTMIPAVFGLYVLATELSAMLYDVPEAGSVLAVLSPALLMLALQQTTAGALQGLGKPEIPLRNLTLGALAKLVLTWWLVPLPGMGILGAAVGTVAGFGLSALLNFIDLSGISKLNFDAASWMIKPGLATLLMALATRGSYDVLISHVPSNTIVTLFAVTIGAGVYGCALLLVGGLSVEDVESIPKAGRHVSRLLQKLGLLRK